MVWLYYTMCKVWLQIVNTSVARSGVFASERFNLLIIQYSDAELINLTAQPTFSTAIAYDGHVPAKTMINTDANDDINTANCTRYVLQAI